jgi:TonB family protein
MADDKEFSTPAEDAGTRWHDLYDRYFRIFAVVAVALHAILIFFVVAPRGGQFAARAEELEVIELPPEIRIPPPPEEIARPATPVIAEEPVEEDITIAETVIEENAPVPEAPPPPPSAEPEVGNTFTFTPYTVKPRCTRGCDNDNILRHLPALLRRSGVTCTLTVGVRIDTSGNVTATDMLKSSGNPGCDQGALEWARTTKWTTAMNRDQPVVVWISQPLTIGMTD